MPSFGKSSQKKLNTCDIRLQKILNEVIKHYDFSVISGHRGKAEQNQLVNEGKSKLAYPRSKHNTLPSLAVDVAPYPIDWNDTARFYYLAGLITATAHTMGYTIRWGGDWDSDNEFSDNRFNDLPHFEIVD